VGGALNAVYLQKMHHFLQIWGVDLAVYGLYNLIAGEIGVVEGG